MWRRLTGPPWFLVTFSQLEGLATPSVLAFSEDMQTTPKGHANHLPSHPLKMSHFPVGNERVTQPCLFAVLGVGRLGRLDVTQTRCSSGSSR